METCKCISGLTNQLCYWFGLLKDRTPTHCVVSTLTDFTEDNRHTFKHKVSLDSTPPAYFGGGCPLCIDNTSIGLHNLQVLCPHIRCLQKLMRSLSEPEKLTVTGPHCCLCPCCNQSTLCAAALVIRFLLVCPQPLSHRLGLRNHT
jgi:hypothetical protein